MSKSLCCRGYDFVLNRAPLVIVCLLEARWNVFLALRQAVEAGLKNTSGSGVGVQSVSS